MSAENRRAVDSSVIIAAFAPWHENHRVAAAAIREGARVPAHAMLEVYSVLTRLPGDLRMPGKVVREYLERTFPPARVLTVEAERQPRLVREIERTGITGGATYDALIALTAAGAEATLVSLDRRAVGVYERCGVAAELAAT